MDHPQFKELMVKAINLYVKRFKEHYTGDNIDEDSKSHSKIEGLAVGAYIPSSHKSDAIEANQDIKKREELYHPDGMGLTNPISIFEPIRLADVLLAIWKKTPANKTNIRLESDGQFLKRREDTAWHLGPTWNLHADRLEDQSDETLAFINSLISL